MEFGNFICWICLRVRQRTPRTTCFFNGPGWQPKHRVMIYTWVRSWGWSEEVENRVQKLTFHFFFLGELWMLITLLTDGLFQQTFFKHIYSSRSLDCACFWWRGGKFLGTPGDDFLECIFQTVDLNTQSWKESTFWKICSRKSSPGVPKNLPFSQSTDLEE